MNMSDLIARPRPRRVIVPGSEQAPAAAPMPEISRFLRTAPAGIPGAPASQKDGSLERRALRAARPVIDTVTAAPLNSAAMLARIRQIAAAAGRPATA